MTSTSRFWTRSRTAAALVSLVAAQVAANAWFTAAHTAGNPGDEVNHLQTALRCFHEGPASLLHTVYPPLNYFVSLLAHHLLGVLRQADTAAQHVFFAALLTGVFGCARSLGASRGTALLACVLAWACPMTALLSRMAMLDFSLVGMVALALWRLLATRRFHDTRASFVFGAVAGLGMLARESFVIFLAAPALIELARGVLSPENGVPRRRVAGHALAALGFGIAVAAVWYVPSYATKFGMGLARVTLGANHPDLSFLSWKGFWFYPYVILDLVLSPWLAVFLIAAAFGFARIEEPAKWTLVAAVIVPWIVFSQLDWKLARYIAPVAPVLSILTSVGIGALRAKTLRAALSVAAAAVAVFVWTGFTFGFVPTNRIVETGLPRGLLGFSMAPSEYREDIHVGPPNRSPSPLEDVGDVIRPLAARRGGAKVVRFLNVPGGLSGPAFFESPLNLALPYLVARDNLNVRLLECYFDRNGALTPAIDWRDFDSERDILGADLLIGYAPWLSETYAARGFRFVMRFIDHGVEKEILERE